MVISCRISSDIRGIENMKSDGKVKSLANVAWHCIVATSSYTSSSIDVIENMVPVDRIQSLANVV